MIVEKPSKCWVFIFPELISFAEWGEGPSGLEAPNAMLILGVWVACNQNLLKNAAPLDGMLESLDFAGAFRETDPKSNPNSKTTRETGFDCLMWTTMLDFSACHFFRVTLKCP